jgi:cytosine deaminase
MTISELHGRFVQESQKGGNYKEQEVGVVVCEEALAAARAGNYGVGAVLVDPAGQIVERARNQAFYPRFRSDLHAEMVVMNSFEDRFPEANNMRGYTLVSSLEPCPMCVARLLIAGVQTVKYLTRDELGGMVGRMDDLPTAWKRLGQRQQFVQADVSEGLRQIALEAFLLNLEALREKLWSR